MNNHDGGQPVPAVTLQTVDDLQDAAARMPDVSSEMRRLPFVVEAGKLLFWGGHTIVLQASYAGAAVRFITEDNTPADASTLLCCDDIATEIGSRSTVQCGQELRYCIWMNLRL